MTTPLKTKHPVFPLSALQFSVLCFLVQTLETRQIAYQVTGALAGNIYGSSQPLLGIEIHIARIDRPRSAAALAAYVTASGDPAAEQALYLQIQGVGVELRLADAGGPPSVDLAQSQRMDFLGLMLSVQPLENLIRTQMLLGADVADLLALK
jgi:hypothetical protein